METGAQHRAQFREIQKALANRGGGSKHGHRGQALLL